MPRDIPVGNGQMLVAFDRDYQVRDLYFPHVGQENHTGGNACRFGVWAALPQTPQNRGDRRKRRLFWTNQGWKIDRGYQPDTLATDVRLVHEELRIELRCTDVVDFHRPVLVRRIEVVNTDSVDRVVHLCHHNNFSMYGTRVGDTAYFDPRLRCLLHYRGNRYLMAGWYADGEPRIDEFATGLAGFQNAEGTWRDAEDGKLGGNTIAQGAVDSTMMLQLELPPGGSRLVYLIVGAGCGYKDIETLNKFIRREGPQGVIDRTTAYWRLWLAASRCQFTAPEHGGPSPRAVELYKRSLLIMRTQVDNSGAIIAANDTDIMQFARDTYSYFWPRDGALVTAALDDAGFPDVARSFYLLCAKLISEHGYFLHKYNPDGSPASSWHPWVSLGKPQLPIQEDETALVIWALWRHYVLYRDIEFVRHLWLDLIVPAADFLVRFRDPDTRLPLPSYDLWEERWGVHAFTTGAVYGGLEAAWQFAQCFGDIRRAQAYGQAAQETRLAFANFLWSQQHGRYLRRIVPLDHNRTARMMAEVMDDRTPRASGASPLPHQGRGSARHDATAGQPVAALKFEYDPVLDSSLCGIFAFGMMDVHDPRVEQTMHAVHERLWLKTPVGGMARYEGDTYHRFGQGQDANVPGNPWFVCTLWLAQWLISRADSPERLRDALPFVEWAADHALPSGVMAEQVHPQTHQPLSVSPLTWSHAAVVSTLTAYMRRLEAMDVCPTCGQPRGHDHPTTAPKT
jgi:GH15 family glucan-1,4-alpha-glucosidase